MDKTSDRVNRQTLEFSNRVYEELSTIVCHRGDLRYFSYDHNDEKIDGKLERMFELLDDIYNSSIEKKLGWISSKPVKPQKLVFPEEDLPDVDIHTPEPRTPVKKEKVKKKKVSKIKVEESDIQKDVLETILYSSDEDNDFERL